MLPLVEMVTLHSRAVIPCWPIPYARAQPYHLGRWQLWDDTYICILLYYTDINWLLLTASAILSASVISLHNRGGGSTISFLHHIKIKK